MEQKTGLAAPKIVNLDFTPLEYVLPPEKAYGMARGLNFPIGSRPCACAVEGGV